MKHLIVTIFLTLPAIFPSPGANQDPTRQPKISEAARTWIDMIGTDSFNKSGLSSLTSEQLNSLSATVSGLIQANTPPSNLWQSAKKKMQQLGWEEVQIVWVNVDGEDWIVVPGRFGEHATKDIPFGMSSIGTPSGTYWGQRSPFGGLRSILDSYGLERSFLFADWKNL